MNNRTKGFTLLELMVVVAIIGIISAIAYPSYDRYMFRSRRADAKTALTKIVSLEERYYLQYNSYTTDLTSAPSSGGLGMTSAISDNGYYYLTVTASAGGLVAGYTATADATSSKLSPVSPQKSDTTTPEGNCTIMTLDSAGVKTPSKCWGG